MRWGTTAEAAAESGKSVPTIRRWAAEGVVRAERVGTRHLRVDLDSLVSSPSEATDLTGPQLTAALTAITPEDLAALARCAGRLVDVVPSPVGFAKVWSAIGAVARVEARKRERND